MSKILHIAVDGNSGSGKTTLSRHLAKKYGLFYVDSGSIYNFATFHLLRQGKCDPAALIPEDVEFLSRIILQEDGGFLFEGVRYCEELVCTEEVKQHVSFFAKLPFLRQQINEKIWQTITDIPAVVNGRDIGTIVLPEAPVKIYMQVSLEHRIVGWKKMLIHRHGYLPEDQLQALIDNATLRDKEDSQRKIAPLACAEDAIRFDSGSYSLDQIFEMIDGHIDRWLQQNQQRPILSICIPTYNRAAIVKACLEKLTSFTMPSLEFVVCDDASSDNTAEVIGEFRDPRISFYRNQLNGGASYNSHLSFLRAKGKYALLISDEDDLFEQEIAKLLELFEKNDDIAVYIAGGIRGENDIKKYPAQEYPDGFSALWQLGYCTRYMTGVIFNTDLYRAVIGEVSYEDAPKVFSVYSFMYAMAKLFFNGRVITSDAMIFRENRFTATTLTNNAKDAPNIFYFEPKGRESQIRCSVKSMAQLPLTQQQQKMMLLKIFFDTADVTLRVFDKQYLPRYQEMIPAHYDMFLSHIAGADMKETLTVLYKTMRACAQEMGVCTEQALEDAIASDEHLRTFVRMRSEKIAAAMTRISQYS